MKLPELLRPRDLGQIDPRTIRNFVLLARFGAQDPRKMTRIVATKLGVVSFAKLVDQEAAAGHVTMSTSIELRASYNTGL